jgi:hypothetical protein
MHKRSRSVRWHAARILHLVLHSRFASLLAADALLTNMYKKQTKRNG